MRSAEQWPGKGRSTGDRVRAYGYGECYAGASLSGYSLHFCFGIAVLSALTTKAVHLQGMSRGTSVLLLQY